MKKKLLLIRYDKIGDLVCTLPVDESIPTEKYEITWGVSTALQVVLDHTNPARNYFTFSNFQELRTQIRRIQPDLTVVFYAPWWVSFVLFLEQVPVRAGRTSQWHSWLFLNKTMRQSRSRPTQHEAQYNQDLLSFALDLPQQKCANLHLAAKEKLKSPLEAKRYYVVHPGMAGSALNWPPQHYAELLTELSRNSPVVITGTNMDEIFLKEVRSHLKDSPHLLWMINQLSLSELLTVLSQAKAVIAPSTGVAHLATSVGAQVFSLFPPMPGQGPIRWSPRGSSVQILTPSVTCPSPQDCWKDRCPHFNCMRLLTPMEVLKKLL